jgi:hypothetical protein
MTKEPAFQHQSTRTAGNDPIEGVDPGGTRSTHPGQADKTAPKKSDPSIEQTVKSGDRNPQRESRSAAPK